MKRKTARELLVDSFRELAAEKNIDRITIRDITDNSGYSSATFYRQFRDKYDLIAWDYTRDIEKIMDQADRSESSWKQALQEAAEYYQEHKDYLRNLLLHTSGYDSFSRYMIEINHDSLKKWILLSSGLKETDSKSELLIRSFCIGTVSLTCEWILGKHCVTSDELAEIYEESLPEPLHESLYGK